VHDITSELLGKIKALPTNITHENKSDFSVVNKAITGGLPFKIPLFAQSYNMLSIEDRVFTEQHFTKSPETSTNFLALLIEMIVKFPIPISSCSEFNNIFILDLLIRMPLQMVLSAGGFHFTRSTQLSTYLNEPLRISTKQISQLSSSLTGGSSLESTFETSSAYSSVSSATNSSSSSNKSRNSSSLAKLKPSSSSANTTHLSATTAEILRAIFKSLNSRPDCTVFSNFTACLIMEEKPTESMRGEADEQLAKTLGKTDSLPTVIFGNVPFLFVITACGNCVELACYSHANKMIPHTISKYSLSNNQHKTKLALDMMNLARVLRVYQDKFLSLEWPYRGLPFFQKIRRDLGSFVLILTDRVVKSYEKETSQETNMFTYEDAERVYDFYMYLRANSSSPRLAKYAVKCVNQPIHPNLTQLYTDTMVIVTSTTNGAAEDAKKAAKNKPSLDFHLAPLCAHINNFKNVKDFVHALWCVIQVLVKFHADGYVHGDVRWGNVMYDVVDGNYRLIDLDNGGKSPVMLSVEKSSKLKGLPKPGETKPDEGE
jgi:hypothetical protein